MLRLFLLELKLIQKEKKDKFINDYYLAQEHSTMFLGKGEPEPPAQSHMVLTPNIRTSA